MKFITIYNSENYISSCFSYKLITALVHALTFPRRLTKTFFNVKWTPYLYPNSWITLNVEGYVQNSVRIFKTKGRMFILVNQCSRYLLFMLFIYILMSIFGKTKTHSYTYRWAILSASTLQPFEEIPIIA